ncbi:unnamed protein product [Microthlaspi erraticum]|uniref:Uncharacterized protein n=1 Tax=Microthlaspi erraticum TaxID=1685480 RepID=A0A6D2JQE0_9BRAS|nr:unnamed protein product [Microthlaspi erraticum]
MQCYTNEEALASLYINVSTSFFLLLLLLYSAVSLLLNLFHFIGGYPLLQRSEDEYDSAAWLSDEEEEEEEEEEEGREFKMSCNTSYHVISRNNKPDHLIADIEEDGESLVFYNNNSKNEPNNRHTKEFMNVHQTHEQEEEYDQDSNISSTEDHFSSANVSPYRSESSLEDEDQGVEDLHDDRYDHVDDIEETEGVSRYDVVEDLIRKRPNRSIRGPSPLQRGLVFNDKSYNGEFVSKGGIKNEYVEIQPSSRFDTREIKAEEILEEEEEEEERGEIFGESCTNGSTSKSSSEWRNSVKTDDPFSSSSRRSCPKWESYTVFQKYDEEMTFLTRVSAQKLHETESLKSIMVEPRSISERIVRKLSSNVHKKKQKQHTSTTTNGSRPNPYVELESAYVAQMCLTWEALSWNYKNFERKRSATQRISFNDIGCPAVIADQFRTFHILLQRYVENEPYENGKRPEIYARMRTLAPKLLLVPEYQDYEEEEEKLEEEEEGFKSRITSASFLMIMEECIRTFMNFLKADKEKPCQKIIKAFFGRPKRGSVDPTLVHLMKKVNTKKKTKLKEMRKGGKYMRKKKMSIEEEMEILMGLIDLKVVSRVLRMNDINEEKLHWCEEKMTKVKIIQDGKALQRDSTPLFFPPH